MDSDKYGFGEAAMEALVEWDALPDAEKVKELEARLQKVEEYNRDLMIAKDKRYYDLLAQRRAELLPALLMELDEAKRRCERMAAKLAQLKRGGKGDEH